MTQTTQPGPLALWAQTLNALAAPRRALPVALVAAPLLAAQLAFSVRPGIALVLALGMLAAFWLTGPFAWRALAPRGALGTLVWAGLALLPFAGAVAMTELAELDASFLLDGLNGGVAAGLFLAGGWGLGRDVELEASLQAERARADALKRQADAAELLALRAHLDPHFLFNTLNAIAEWCTIDPKQAEIALLRLSGLLREILGGVRAERWPASRELAVARDVLALYAVRDPERFQAVWDGGIDAGTVPPLLLLPVVENAMTHGPGAGHRGVVRIGARRDGAWLEVIVESPGPLGPPRDGGEGVKMVRDRLALAYGARASFTLDADGDRTRAVVRWPFEE